MRKLWGLLTSLDLFDCNPDHIRDENVITAYVVQLCKLIDMRRFGPCRTMRFGEGELLGWSAIQLIETSSITCHFAEPTNAAYIDVFSCKAYDTAVVSKFSKEFFEAKEMTTTVLNRYETPRERGDGHGMRGEVQKLSVEGNGAG
jgi:S-adenosylmethionine/arginine decarboxylase-like enzyme